MPRLVVPQGNASPMVYIMPSNNPLENYWKEVKGNPSQQIKNWKALERVSDGFAGASGDIFKGVFGALDGLALKIRCPIISEIIANPGNTYCRNGFYAV